MKSRLAALTLVLAISGCVSKPTRDAVRPNLAPSPLGERSDPPLKSRGMAPPTGAAETTARGGAYYQDDGPARDTPDNLDRTPDAVPRLEPISKGTARPYEVLGRSYMPHTQLKPFRQKGIASWYGKKYHGRKTASGEIYDMFAMSAAHTVLPIPSFLRVTNPANGKQVVVRLNDRGPFHRERIVDLSYAAAHRLGLIGKGSGEVEIEQIIPGENDNPITAPAPKPILQQKALPTTAELDQLIAHLPGNDAPLPPGVYIQLGAFTNPENADLLRNALGRELEWLNEPVHIAAGGNFHRVQIGPYRDRAGAERAAARIVSDMGGKPAFVTR